MKIELEPIAFVRGGRSEVVNDDWGDIRADIELDAARFSRDAIAGIASFSHLVVIYHFHKVDPATIELIARHPRENPAWPKVGIFARGVKIALIFSE